MPWFFKQQNTPLKDSLTDEEKIVLVEKAYEGFQKNFHSLKKNEMKKLLKF